jgi:Dinucleotide-utilizing enzymes involved in molybdopterin and thiamine biosynthesis family 2
MYNNTVLDHFANPRNVGDFPNPDGVGHSGNPIDGDTITIYIKVDDLRLSGVRFKTFGCGAAIAASSMLTQLATRKTLSEALLITNDDVAEALGGLPPEKLLCSNIAADALHDAIHNYMEARKKDTAQKKVLPAIAVKEQEHVQNNLIEEPGSLSDPTQIKRYLRHIIMPDIGGHGQKKLLDTKILVCAADLNHCDFLLRYLTALGIGHIECYLENDTKWESVFDSLKDLNPDVTLGLVKEMPDNIDFNLIFGDSRFTCKITQSLLKAASETSLVPTIIAVSEGWQGCFNYCDNWHALSLFQENIIDKGFPTSPQNRSKTESSPLGKLLSSCFLGTLIPIELVKIRLGLGSLQTDIFYFDLIKLIFDNQFATSSTLYTHYDPIQNEIVAKLKEFKILTIGAGGLGCPANLVLAKAGVKYLTLIDFDQVEISNLNRQILHLTSRIGYLKVESAKMALEAVSPLLHVNTYTGSFSSENARALVGQHDLVIDGLDNLPTRYLLNDACYLEKKPLIEAGALAYYGQVTDIIPDEGPCFRCLFPEADTKTAGSCSETGVLGPVPGVIGVLQAVEAIKQLLEIAPSLKGKLLMVDTLESSFDLFNFKKYEDCPLCGKNPSIHELGSFSFVCEDV